MERRKRLLALFEEVESRSAALARAHPNWPCSRGCGACCRSLARVPELTRSEWSLLAEALAQLPVAERAACLRQADLLAQGVREHGAERSCPCPLLDVEQGTCRVYAARPLACRSYGFYAGRSHDAWCTLVAEHVAEVRAELVLGNLDASEAELIRIDPERRDLLSWLSELPEREGTPPRGA